MKARALCLIDYEIEGGFIEAAKEEEALKNAIKDLCTKNKQVVHFQVNMKDRRGDTAPDLNKMKFRTAK